MKEVFKYAVILSIGALLQSLGLLSSLFLMMCRDMTVRVPFTDLDVRLDACGIAVFVITMIMGVVLNFWLTEKEKDTPLYRLMCITLMPTSWLVPLIFVLCFTGRMTIPVVDVLING